MSTGTTFGRHRKIAPFDPGASEAELRRASREKAASLNQHLLGYGETAEREWAAAGIAAPDLAAMRRYRLERIRAELKRRDYAGALLYDPINIRYATDSTNMQLWVAHNPTRHCFVAAEGPVVLFDYFSCEHLSDHSGMVDDVRPAVSWIYLYGGELTERRVERWADGISDLVKAHGGGNKRITVDHLDHEGVAALAARGISIGNGRWRRRLSRASRRMSYGRSCIAATSRAAVSGSRRACFPRAHERIRGSRSVPRA
jgi:hypothetical protein